MRLDRLLLVLEAIALAGKPLTAAEVHEMTELPVPTCYRLLQVLKQQRLLETAEHGNGFVIGARLRRIAELSATDKDLSTLAAPVLSSATERFGAAVFLSRFRQQGVSIIHVETPADAAQSYIHPGLGFRPMHACSCSKVIAAFADTSFRELILGGPKKAYTPQTLTQRKALEEEFQRIQKAGYAECVEEIEVGVSSVAAPVYSGDQGAVFSVGTIGSMRRFTTRHRHSVGRKLIGIANELSAILDRRNQHQKGIGQLTTTH